ncbi:MAG: multicopper oxidase domain-containing protein [Acidobacteria bacterium]|nr:multicopper oxidase domain-containing protein [Acidobacteriota bacterium]
MALPGRVFSQNKKPSDTEAFLRFGFVNELKIPKTLSPSRRDKHGTVYHLRMQEGMHSMHSSLPATRVWGYEGMYPGPSIEAAQGERVEIVWENLLPTTHIFKIDRHIHGAMAPTPEVRTVPHLHGMRTTSKSDGLPEEWFVPGKKVRYTYKNEQRAAMLWYHDHAVGITRLNVYAGLSGLYFLRDEEEKKIGLPSGEYEIPLILQDRTLDEHGQLVYDPAFDDGVALAPGIWGPEFLGKLPVVNGTICPFANVEPRTYRLRILNASNSRFFRLQFNLSQRATDIPDLINMQQIGSDGGLLPKPVLLNQVLVGPAERVDLLVDFTKAEGKTVTVTNDAEAPFPDWGMGDMEGVEEGSPIEVIPRPDVPRLDELMQFRVVLPRKDAAGMKGLKIDTSSFIRFKESDAVRSRDFVLTEHMDKDGKSLGVRINEKGYDDPVTEIVKLGSVETWRFINTTADAHPMHIHLVQFQILHRQGFDHIAMRGGSLKPIGTPRPPDDGEAGWKDTAVVLPNEMLTIIARFEGYEGKFVFHCHMLEHEDNDMMRPFVVVK